ncbi:tyrosine-type recombinase/integrase [Jiangella gansuensis]|uniref:tyrosine-type recombinase/integrase n=1 Tax=Jiangella gansuensis TaxID=281473 RepID=UPI0004B8BBA4|nr:tyrosine-type recombinase/integrase [Jiangella gansuensis]
MTPPSNKGMRFPPEPLTRAEVGALLGAASRRSNSGVRLRALVATLYGSGLRISEALALLPKDVDLDAGTVRVRNGKGGKSRLVGIDPYSASLIQAWLDRRAQLGLTHRHPVFASYSKGHVGDLMSPRYVRAALAKLGMKAGIAKRVHPHGLRHSLAFDMAETGTPVHSIQRQLGHASLAITSRYVDHLRPTDVVQTMRARDWQTA